jgi:hypothetical protein
MRLPIVSRWEAGGNRPSGPHSVEIAERRVRVRPVAGSYRFRLIDTAGSELGIIDWPAESVALGEAVNLANGRAAPVVDIYDDEYGQVSGVQATLVVDDES